MCFKGILTIFLIISVFFTDLFSQGIGENRITKIPLTLEEYSMKTDNIKSARGKTIVKAIKENSKFVITGKDNGGDYIVYFWNFEDQSKYIEFNYDVLNTEYRFFLIPGDVINIVTEKIYKTISPVVGSFTFPFRLRTQHDDKFEKSFSLSLCGGIKWNPWKTNEHNFSMLFGVGASSVTLTKANTAASSGITENIEAGALTFSISLMYEWERLQIGFSMGMDNLFDNENIKWKYQSDPWLSFGVGVSLFSKSEITSIGTNNN